VNLKLDLTMMVGAISETVEVMVDRDHHALLAGRDLAADVESCLPVPLPAGRRRRKRQRGHSAVNRRLSAFLDEQDRCDGT
jgi:hypothetical protein